MADDIRLAIDMDHNVKVLRLEKELGPGATWSLIRLWLYTARHRPEGVLTGISPEEIEPLVGWRRRRGRLIEALERLGFIEMNGTGTLREVTIHDWPVHQPWVSGQTRRSEVARQNVSVRWGKRDAEKPEASGKYKGGDTDRITGRTTAGNTAGNTDPILLSFPSPIQDLPARVPAGGSEAPAVPPEPYRGADACKHPHGCTRRGTIKVNGKDYCRRHDPDNLQEPDLIGSVFQKV